MQVAAVVRVIKSSFLLSQLSPKDEVVSPRGKSLRTAHVSVQGAPSGQLQGLVESFLDSSTG